MLHAKDWIRMPYWLSASVVGVLSLCAMIGYGSQLHDTKAYGALVWFSLFTTITAIQIPIHLGLLMPARLSPNFYNKLTMRYPKLRADLNPENFYDSTLMKCNYALLVVVMINALVLAVSIKPLVNDEKVNVTFYNLFLAGTFIHAAVLALRMLAKMMGTTEDWFSLAW